MVAEYVNNIVCSALILCLLPCAAIAHKGAHRASIIALAVALLWEMIASAPPGAQIGWPMTAINVALLWLVIVWRRGLWEMLSKEFR